MFKLRSLPPKKEVRPKNGAFDLKNEVFLPPKRAGMDIKMRISDLQRSFWPKNEGFVLKIESKNASF